MTETQTGETSWWPVITAEAASGWRKLSDDLAAGYDTDRALVEGWWREAWARTFKKPPFWAAQPVPVAEVVPPENDGLRLTESGHTDPAAVSEGDAAAGGQDECPMEAVFGGGDERLPCRLPRGHEGGHDYMPEDAADLPGGPTVSEAEGAEPVNAPAGQPDQGRTPTDVEAGLITQQQKDLSSDQGLDWHSPDQATVTDSTGEATS